MKINVKKVLFPMLFMLGTIGGINAQIDREREYGYYPKNEIYIQYGVPSVQELVTTLQVDYKSASGSYDGESRNHKFSGVGGFGYNFSISKKMALGVYGGVSYSSADLYITNMEDVNLKEPVMVCRSNIMCYTGQVSVSMTYWQRGAWECSGALYLGVAYLAESIDVHEGQYFIPTPDSRWKFSYHLTPVKFRYGNAIGVFGELGFGYRGLLNVGLSVKI